MSVSRLCTATLAHLPAAVARPVYDRARMTRGIVHLGLGAFHRAHQALYTEAALAAGDLRWGIAGASLRGEAVRDALRPQDHLYSVIERHGENARARVVGAVIDAWHAPSSPDAVLSALADPAVRIVTSTVTEKGYSQHAASGELDRADADIQHDLRNLDRPRSALGVLAAGLRRRPADAPLTIVCCDNMARNGDVVRRLLAAFARASGDAALAARIEHDVAFPNTMVDRIVPAATAESLAFAQAQLGVRDEAAIVCEPFTQWVIEDRFAGARPEWERGGALFVQPFQALKLRLLNGTHSAIAYLGQLRGLETVADVMADAALGPFVRTLMTEDLRGTVVVPAGFDVPAYCAALLHRFGNPTLRHRTAQIAMDGTQKIAVRWTPVLRAGRELPRLERALAAWLHYLNEQRDERGVALTISDPGAAGLSARLREAGDAEPCVRAALAHDAVFGAGAWPDAFVQRVAQHLRSVRRGGVAALVDA